MPIAPFFVAWCFGTCVPPKNVKPKPIERLTEPQPDFVVGCDNKK
jgi:hypothetical protein